MIFVFAITISFSRYPIWTDSGVIAVGFALLVVGCLGGFGSTLVMGGDGVVIGGLTETGDNVLAVEMEAAGGERERGGILAENVKGLGGS